LRVLLQIVSNNPVEPVQRFEGSQTGIAGTIEGTELTVYFLSDLNTINTGFSATFDQGEMQYLKPLVGVSPCQ